MYVNNKNNNGNKAIFGPQIQKPLLFLLATSQKGRVSPTPLLLFFPSRLACLENHSVETAMYILIHPGNLL